MSEVPLYLPPHLPACRTPSLPAGLAPAPLPRLPPWHRCVVKGYLADKKQTPPPRTTI